MDRNYIDRVILKKDPPADSYLITFPHAQIYQLSGDGITEVRYQETEHYQLTKYFLNHPDQMLKYLLVDTDQLQE